MDSFSEDGIAALEIAEKKAGGLNSVLATLAFGSAELGRGSEVREKRLVLLVRTDPKPNDYVTVFY